MVQARERLHRFDFNNDLALNKDVDAVACIYLQALIDHWQHQLALNPNASRCEFMSQALLINRFKQTWPKRPVHLQAGIDNQAG